MKLTVLLLFISSFAVAQESIYVQMDKTVCFPGDTLWFRGDIFHQNRPSNLSEDMTLEVWNDSSRQLFTGLFPIYAAACFGQFPAPLTPGLYWIKAFTSYSQPKFISLTVRDTSSRVVVRVIDESRQVNATTSVGGLDFNTTYLPQRGLECLTIADSSTIFNKEILRVLIKYYDDTLWQAAFTVHSGKQVLIAVPTDSLPRITNGYVTVLYEHGDSLLTTQEIFIPQREAPPINLVSTDSGYALQIADSGNWNYALSVVKTDLAPSENIKNCLDEGPEPSNPEPDPLTYQFVAVKDNRREKPVRNKNVIVLFHKDSTSITKLLRTDSLGKITFGDVFFYDSAQIQFMLNGSSAGIKLELVNTDTSRFVPPDSTDFGLDTISMPYPKFVMPTFDTVKYLAPAIVTPRWIDRNKALDNRFATGRFGEISPYSWNIMKMDLKYVYDLWTFLRVNFGVTYSGFPGDVPRYNNHYVTFWLDGECTNYRYLPTRLSEIAYIKILITFPEDGDWIRRISDIPLDTPDAFPKPYRGEKVPIDRGRPGLDNTPKAEICMWRRTKNEDFANNPSLMNSIKIKGFTRPATWTRKDRTTLLWNPYVTQKLYKFNLPAKQKGPVKLVAEGVNQRGQVFHYEKTLML